MGGFQPASVTISAGESVTWTNKTNVTHAISGSGAGTFGATIEASGGTYTHRFSTAGAYTVRDTLTQKEGVVVVLAAPSPTPTAVLSRWRTR